MAGSTEPFFAKGGLLVPNFPERLRGERFDRNVPKRVDYSKLWKPRPDLVPKNSPEERDLLDIIYAVTKGNLVPERCYRNRIGHTADRLLAEQGIKHLHLGGANSDVILYLVEYESFVLLLEIGSHKDLETEPPGSVLASLHHACLRRGDATSVAERIQRVATRARIAVTGLLPKRRRD